MFRSICLTIVQLAAPSIRLILMVAIVASSLFIIAITFGINYALTFLAHTGINWFDKILIWFGSMGAFLCALILFPSFAQMISGLFTDRISNAVISTYYPNLTAERHIPINEMIGYGIRFSFLSMFLNIVALPFYFLLPGFNLIIFYILNSYLLGREYAEMIGLRTLDKISMRLFWEANRTQIFLGGAIITTIAFIPALNLTTPVAATTFAIHEHERLRRLAFSR
ncbi:hypothetical protein A1OE_434 [Candidatus Endolissoclinum faulkneri L2]|uniref:Etoposide-induced 2.4 family protein n=1 Tax=Candidatus Endolissoclinum faulkneri L2 TaxID=1193729 RepID=K7YM90_9PROT|nr:EI24 domain-containing protein [Candidatus Endolissoclinum faulkneri]AFX98627.1 hypothetical protein A1OE_434 [Candidatus Endolissoclinum faulkneri L2]